METNNQTQLRMLNPNDKSFRILFLYSDGAIRGLVAFAVVLPIVYLLVNYSNIKIYFILPIVLILSIALSPLLNKIEIGHWIVMKYLKVLDSIIYKLNKHKIENVRN